MSIHVDPSGEHISNAPIEFTYFLQKHIILPEKSVRADVFVNLMKIDYLSSLKELRYHYKMFGSMDKEIEDTIVSLNEYNKVDCNKRLQKEHSYITSTPYERTLENADKSLNFSVSVIEKDYSYSQITIKSEPGEEWGKINSDKRKAIRPKPKTSKKIAKIKLNRKKCAQ